MTPRLAIWAARVLTAAAAGTAWRGLRRLFRRPPRIWHGFSPLHATRAMVAADRMAGLPSSSVVFHTRATNYALVRSEDFDLVIESANVAWNDVHWLGLIHLLLHGDIWSAYFDSLFFNLADERTNTAAFRLIRLCGLRIVVQPHGSDVVYETGTPTRFDWIRRFQMDYPDWDLGAHRRVVDVRVRLFSRFADFILGGYPPLRRFIPRSDVMFHSVPIDCAALVPVQPSNAVPRVVHAPNHRHVKGTDILLASVERLKGLGVACEVMLIERIPRHEALHLYNQADIVADQFIIGAYGVFALEGLALGKPVLTYLDEEDLRNPVFSHPIVNTTAGNIDAVLAALLLVPELRDRLGSAGRESVMRYQSIEAMAEVWGRIYRHVWWGELLRLESTHHFGPDRKARPLGEDPAEEVFWPVPVADLMPAIRLAVARVRPSAQPVDESRDDVIP